MFTYFFQLGTFPQLSLAELAAVFPGQPSLVLPDVAAITTEKALDPEKVINSLGGTIKVLQQLKQLADTSESALLTEVTESLHQIAVSQDGKISFALAELGRDHLPMIEPAQVKELLIEQGVKTRYVEGSRHGLSAAILTHKAKVRELYVLQTPERAILAQTLASQPIDEWTLRDRSKPYADRKKGMLPPKVARILVNLAIGPHALEPNKQRLPTILDPFCGSGTVLMEAALSHCHSVGSDVDPDAVTGTKANLEWLKQNYDIDTNSRVLLADAAKLELPTNQVVTHLVTEPFLGKPKPQPQQLPNIFRGLERMYLGAFKNWTRFLPDGAKLVVVFPYVQLNEHRIYSLEKLIDKLSQFGYTITSQPLLYARPQAIVQRQIVQLEYTKK